MKRYVVVLRVTALLVVLSLTGPSVATLACEWACASQRPVTATAQPDADCHDQGDSSSDGVDMVAGHGCHDLADMPTLVNPAAVHTAPAPAIVRLGRSSLDDNTRPFQLLRAVARLKPHDPPPLASPLRI